jgi:hypothetical protein
MVDVYMMHLENRAMSRSSERVRDLSYAVNDPFLYDSIIRDGQGEEFGYESEEKNIKKAAKDMLKIAGQAGARTLQDLVKGNSVAEVLVENPNFDEEHYKMDLNDSSALVPFEQKREKSKRVIAPKISPGIKHFRAGVDFGDWVSLRWKSEYDLEDSELEARARMRMFHDLHFTGFYERKIYERTNSYGGGVFWGKFGATYSRDDSEEDVVMLEFNSSRK